MSLSNHRFNCSPFNIDGIHSQMEMLLASLYDGSYHTEPRTLIATDGMLEYTYTKEGMGNRMSLRVTSLEAPKRQFKVRYGGKKFHTQQRVHPLLDMSELM